MKRAAPIKTLAEIELVKNYLKRKSERNYILFMIGIYTGFSTNRILGLRVKEVNNKCCLLGGSQTIDIYVPSHPVLSKALNSFAKSRKNTDFLIQNSITKENEQLSKMQVYSILHETGKTLGIKNFSIGTLRKTFGFFYYKEFRDLEGLKKLLGQNKLTDTLKFIDWKEEDAFSSDSLEFFKWESELKHDNFCITKLRK